MSLEASKPGSVPSHLSYSSVFVFVIVASIFVPRACCPLVVLVTVPVQVIDWKESLLNLTILC